jgi:hypothetical protein
MIIKIGLGETCIGSISGHRDNNSGCRPLDNYEIIP